MKLQIVFLAACFLLWTFAHAAPGEEGNLLVNPSFEQGDAGNRPLYWGLYDKGEGPKTFVIAEGGRSGSFEARMSKSDPVEWVYAGQYVETRAAEGEVYRYAGWLKASRDTNVTVCIIGMPEKGDRHIEAYITISVGSEWKPFELLLPIKGGASVKFRVQALVMESDVTISLDDFELTRTEFAVKPPSVASGETGKWLEPSDEVVSEHIAWAKPAAAGPVRVLFVTYRNALREVVEICQRFDIEREVFATETMYDFSLPPLRHPEIIAGTMPQEQEARLREKLAGEYDCIVVGNIKWDILPEWARSAILAKVQGGTGLVAHVKPGNYEELRVMLAGRLDEDPREMVSAFPYAGLPAFRGFASFDHFCERALRFAQYGKGRVAVILGRAPEGAAQSLSDARGIGEGIRSPERQMLTCEIADPFPNFHMVEYDYYLALAGHLIRWTGAGERPVRVVEPEISRLAVDRETPGALPIHLASTGAREVALAICVRETDTGTALREEKKKVALVKGANVFSWELPALPAGTYYLDVWVKEGDAVLDYGSLFVEVRSSKRLESLELADLTFSKREKVRGRVVVAGPGAAQTIDLSQWDNHGRRVGRLSLTPAPDNGEYPFEITPAARPLSALGRIEARLVEDGETLDVKRATFTYWDLFPPRDDVRAIVAQGYEEDSYLGVTLARELGGLGFDSLMTSSGLGVYYAAELKGTPLARWVRPPKPVDPKNVHSGSSLLANMRDLMSLYDGVDGQYDWYVLPRGYHGESERGPVRRPCLTNPSYQRRFESFYAGHARRLRAFAIGEYNMGDESTFVHGDHDVCFSDTCIRDFQDFARREYGTIDRLNEEYGSDHKSWREVVPVPFEKAKETGRIPIWIDHRRHMETAWAGYFERARKAIEAEVPGARVGYEGSDDAGHIRAARIGGAENYELLARAMTMNGVYYFPLQLDCVRDFSAPGTLIGGGWFGGYGAIWRAGRDSLHHRWWIWNTLLRGANSLWVFEGSYPRRSDGFFSTLAPDLSPYDFFEGALEEIALAKGGLGKLLMHSERPHDGIAVLYSPSSMLMTAFEDDLPHRWDSAAAASFLFTEAGFQYRMISESQLEAGVLRDENFRVLYLPYCQALSRREAEEILTFAKAGGVVIADLRPGVADEHGKPYERSPLDVLFGIRQVTAAATPQKTAMLVIDGFAGLPDKLPTARSDGSLALAGGKAGGKVGGAPAVVINRHGRGLGVLFNYALSDYMIGHLGTAPSFADETSADVVRRLTQGALRESDIRPPIALAPYIPGTHVFRFDTDGGMILGLLWDAPGFLPGIQWNEEVKIELAAAREETVALKLDAARHLYDVRTGKYLGTMQEVERSIQPGLPHILSALPYRVTGLSISGNATDLSVALAIEPQDAKPGTHVFRIEVLDPQGNPADAYAQNALAPGGTCKTSVPFALDDAPGDWTVTVTDVATGVTGKAVVKKDNR